MAIDRTRGMPQYELGELVPEAVINGAMVGQGVLYFADAAARDAAFTAAGVDPLEGMHCYLADSKIVQEYDGTSWVFLTSAVYTAAGDLAYFNGSKLVRIAAGTSSQVLTIVDGVPAWSTPITGAVVRDGGNTTEASTVSTSSTDVLTASSMSIDAVKPIRVVCSVRKVGTNGGWRVGLKINATTLGEMIVSGAGAVSGLVIFDVGPGVTNYGFGGVQVYAGAPQQGALVSAARPAATVTSVAVRGSVVSGGDTLFFDDLHVYSLAAS